MAKRKEKPEKGQPDNQLLTRPPAPNERRLPFFGVHEQDFEEILVDIAEKEPDIARAELKRKRGVEQYGVDVEGFGDDQKPVLVISCKRYQGIIPSQLITWSNEFLDHLDGHWKDKGVERFVLAVSVELNDDELNTQIQKETVRFKALGLKYEIWGLRRLTDKLRPMPWVIVKYFAASWLEQVGAGPSIAASTSLPTSSPATASSSAASAVAASLAGSVEAIRQRFGDATANRLENALTSFKEGALAPLRLLVDEIRNDRVAWDSLSAELKARFFRAEGSLAIRSDDLSKAKACYADADAYWPPTDRTAATLVVRLESGAAKALELIDTPKTSAEAGVRAGLFLELEDPYGAIATLDRWPATSPADDAYEPERLRSIALLWSDRAAALATITAVEQLSPRHFGLRWAAAVVRFNFALSAKFAPTLGTFPNPIPQGLVRDTEDARRALDEAAQIFQSLSQSVDNPGQAADLQVWKLACLVLNPGRSADAAAFVAGLMETDEPHPGAVVWAAAAGVPFEHEDVLRALNARLKQGGGTASHAIAVAYVTSARGAKDRALSGLRRHRKLFDDKAELELVDYWIGLLSGKGGDEETQRFNAALGKLRDKGDVANLLAMMDSGALQSDMELAAFESLALNGKWLEINDRRSALLGFQTAHAAELAIRAAFGLNMHRDVLSLSDEHASLFAAGKLPSDLRLLGARSRLMLGDANLALQALADLRRDDSSNELAFEDAMIRLRIGDVAGAAAVVRGRIAPKGNPEALFRIAAHLRYEDPRLARDLLAGISFEKLNEGLLPQALAVVQELGLREALNAIMPRLVGSDDKPSGVIFIDSLDEAIRLANESAEHLEQIDADRTTKWLHAEIPLHLVFDGRASEMAWFFYRPFRLRPVLGQDGTLEGKPFLLRGGVRRQNNQPHNEALVVDITALLVGHELDILGKLEHAWANISVPNETPELLQTMEAELGMQFGDIPTAVSTIRDGMLQGRFGSGGADPDLRQLVLGVNAPSEPPTVTLSQLLAHLVAKGMDSDLAARTLEAVGLESVNHTNLTGPLNFLVHPNDLVRLAEVDVLDRLTSVASFSVRGAERRAWLSGYDDQVDGRGLLQKIKALRELVADKVSTGSWHFLPADTGSREELKTTGAAGHLFLSLMKSAEQGPKDIWVEDRTLSLVGKLGGANLVDIVTVLERLAPVVPDLQRKDLQRRLRSAGYGFTMPRTEAVVDALLTAPINGGNLVESDELKAIRRDFAIQFSNSRHLVEKAGSVRPGEPELLFLSRLLGKTGHVLAALWSRPNVGEERLAAAAGWATLHLRIDQSRFLPRENSSVEGRENLMFLQHLSVLTGMFHVTGTSFRQARERRTGMIKWVLSRVVEPAVEIHPAFRQRLIDYLAEALARLKTLDADHPEVTERMLVGAIRDYLDAFPEDWRRQLQRHEKLADSAGLREVQVVGLGDAFNFEATKFYSAIADVFVTGKATLATMESKRTAVISIIPDATPAPDRPTAFLVKSGRKSASFSNDRLELESPDLERRLRALRRHPEWFDSAPAEFEAVAQSIASDPIASSRRDRLNAEQSSAMTWRLGTLQEQILTTGSSDKELLLPPHPDGVRRYLRLSSPFDSAKADWLGPAFRTLRDDVGPLGALARIGGMPFELGPAIEGELLKAVDDVGMDEALRLAGPTPMVRTALYAALVRAGRPEIDLSGLVAAWSDYGGLFQSLLRHAFKSAARRTEWIAVAEPERSMLLWAHANAILEILGSQGAEPKGAARYIDGIMNQRLDDVFDRNRSGAGRLTDPFGRSWKEIARAAIGYVAAVRGREFGDAEREELRTIVARQVGQGWLLDPTLWAPRRSTEPSGCWLALDAAVHIARAGLADLPPPIDERDPVALVRLLEAKVLDQNPSEPGEDFWPIIWLVGIGDLDEEARKRLKMLVGDPGILPDLRNDHDRVWGGALRYRAELYGADGDVLAFETALVPAARQAAEYHLDDQISDLSEKRPSNDTFHQIGEAIWQFSSSHASGLNECTRLFSRYLMVLAREWPNSLLGCLALLDVVAAQLDTEPAAPLWDAINVLRSF